MLTTRCLSPYIMYKRIDKNTNFYVVHIAQTKCSIKYISNINEGVIQSGKNY